MRRRALTLALSLSLSACAITQPPVPAPPPPRDVGFIGAVAGMMATAIAELVAKLAATRGPEATSAALQRAAASRATSSNRHPGLPQGASRSRTVSRSGGGSRR